MPFTAIAITHAKTSEQSLLDKCYSILPTKRLLFSVACAVVLTFVFAVLNMRYFGYIASVIFMAIILLDAVFVGMLELPHIQREHPTIIPLGEPVKISLTIVNQGQRPIKAIVFDGWNGEFPHDDMPFNLSMQGQQQLEVFYFIRANQRGTKYFSNTVLRLQGPLGLWKRQVRACAPSELKVYPNYAEVVRMGLLGAKQKTMQLGIHKRRQRGDGSDFAQLRVFRAGDRMSQIDWKATSRHMRMISREYQVERDQHLMVLLDCGRRMQAHDDKLSYFDQALNSLVLLSSIVSKEGDAFGLMTFGGVSRAFPPIKGPQVVSRLLDMVHDIEPTYLHADVLKASERASILLRKRSLVLLMTDIEPEDMDDTIRSVKNLRKKHQVIVTCLRNPALKKQLKTKVNSLDDALLHSGIQKYILQREEIIGRLQKLGVHVVDTEPDKLAYDLAHTYLDVKQASLI